MKTLLNSSLLAVLLLTFTLACISCENNEGGGDEPNIPDPITEQGTLEDYQSMSIDFGLSMFQDAVSTEEEENVLVSPYSIQSALHMTMNGTDGKTFEEFQTALNTGNFLSDGLGTYYDELAVKLRPSGENTNFNSQNKFYYSPDRFTPDATYQNQLESYFAATFADEDFKDEATVDVINNWINEATEGRIEKVIDGIASDEIIFLINALVFTADWSLGFNPDATQDREFTKSDGSTSEVPTMFSDEIRPVFINEYLSAVDIPAKDQDYAVTFILPGESINFTDFIKGFDFNTYQDLYNKLQSSRILVNLPKFEIATSMDLKDILIDRGMTTTFQSADLSKMGQFPGNQYLTRVLHDVFIKVDEKGVEGAAVTVVGVGTNSVPPAVSFNRPFIFIVRHVETQVPLFIGKVGNPLE